MRQFDILTHFLQLLCTLLLRNMKKLLSSFFISAVGIATLAVPVLANSQSSVSVHVSSNGVSQTRTYTSEYSGVHVYASASNGEAIISIAPSGTVTHWVTSDPTNTPTVAPTTSSGLSATPNSSITPTATPMPIPSMDWDQKSKETVGAFVTELNAENYNIVGWIREWLERHNFSRRTFFTFMSGEHEAPGSGDPDGYGVVRLKVNTDNNEICVRVRTWNIQIATAAHIHKAAIGVAGPIVVPLPTPDSEGKIQRCVFVDNALLTDIKNNPSEYYINVHTGDYPAGAIRGQLQ